MVLISGGAYQGKTDFARKMILQRDGVLEQEQIADGARADWGQLKRAVLVTNLHLWIARLLRQGEDPYQQALRLAEENKNVYLTVNELGCGIVPTDAFDRNWRETTGRVCCALAERAEAVYRVICGQGIRLDPDMEKTIT